MKKLMFAAAALSVAIVLAACQPANEVCQHRGTLGPDLCATKHLKR